MGGESDIGFDNGAAKSVSAGRRSSLLLIRLAIGFLLLLAFKRCADLLHALVVRVLAVLAGCNAG